MIKNNKSIHNNFFIISVVSQDSEDGSGRSEDACFRAYEVSNGVVHFTTLRISPYKLESKKKKILACVDKINLKVDN